MQKTSSKHFKIFKDEVEKLVKEFNIDNWDVMVKHKELGKGVAANCWTKIESYLCIITFATEWSGARSLNDTEIKKVAKHEVIHLLLARLSDYATSRNYTSNDCYEAEEELVWKLINIIK